MSVRATCGQCLAACGIVVRGDGEVEGDPADPVTRGYLCRNGRQSVLATEHPRRLREPLVLGHPAPWKRAIGVAAAELGEAIASGGPDAVGLYFGAGDPAGSVAFLSAMGFLEAIGSRSHYNVVGLEAIQRNVVAEAMFGDPLLVPRPDLERAGALLVLGTNPPVSNDEGGLARALDAARRRGAPIVVLDPRRTELARRATLHLALRPGTDAEVLLAMLHVLFAEGLAKLADPMLAGVDRLRALAEAMPPARAAEVAGLSESDLREAALLLGRAAPVATVARLGIAMSRRSSINEWLACALVGATGGLGRPGGLVHNPGYLDFHGMLRRARRRPDATIGILPPANLADDILAGKLEALVVVAGDPLESLPNSQRVERAFRKLRSLVVLDIAPTATTKLASVVLPAAHHLEKLDVALLLPERMPRRLARLSRPIRRPPGEARSEAAILSALALRMRRPMFGSRMLDLAMRGATALSHDDEGPISPRAMLRVLLPLLSRFQLSLSALEHGFAADPRPLDGSELRERVARGRVDLAPVRFCEAARRALADGPPQDLVLSTCNRAARSINGKLRFAGIGPATALLHMNPEDARERAFEEGAEVVIESAVGHLDARVRIDPRQRRGALAIPFGTPGLNRLTDHEDRDALSGVPAMATVACRVTALEGAT